MYYASVSNPEDSNKTILSMARFDSFGNTTMEAEFSGNELIFKDSMIYEADNIVLTGLKPHAFIINMSIMTSE